MERDGQVSEASGLAVQRGKMINLVCKKISDCMEPNQFAFTIHLIVNQAGQNKI